MSRWPTLRLAAAVLLVPMLLGSQQAAAFTPGDFACPNQGDFGGTCFYEPCPSDSSAATTNSTTVSGGVSFDDSQSSDTSNQTTIDDDGVDPSPTNSPDHQSSTSYADGKLGALHTNYIALNPGWAQANGIVLGDVAALTYKGKTVYAVYGDNHVGNTVHSEISVAAAKALGTSGNDSLTGVHTAVYPGTHTQLAGSVDQAKIDQIGAQASGGGSPSGSSTGTSSSQCECSTGGTTTFGAGTLPSDVKEPYNSIFTAAANKFHVPPAFLAALFYAGEHGSSWPDSPPPYGHGPPWADSHVTGSNQPWPNGVHDGAAGPFQFEYPAWKSNGVDGNGDGKADVEDLTDASFSAAKMLAGSGANTTDTTKLHNAAYSYNGSGPQAEAYASNVMAAYTKFGGTASGAGSGSSTPIGSSGCSQSTSASPDCTSGGATATGDAKILCEAEQYKGIYYLYGGGHGYTGFRQKCPISSISSAAASSTAGSPGPCATDCAGLVSVALDQAFNQTYSWTISIDGSIHGGGSQSWGSIPISQAQAGDIVTVTGTPTSDGHVEIVDHISGGTIYTFGSHKGGTQTGIISAPTSYWTGGAWHWTGPTS